jgi:hypothetical protein
MSVDHPNAEQEIRLTEHELEAITKRVLARFFAAVNAAKTEPGIEPGSSSLR